MAQLPSIRDNHAVIEGARSSVSAQDIANPFQQVAAVLGEASDMFKAKALDDAVTDGDNAVFRDESGQLQVKTRSNLSQTGRAYNRAAMQGYMARLSGDVRAKGAELSNSAKGNPDSFSATWKGFQDELIGRAPRELRGAVTTLLESEGARFGLGVSETKRNRDMKVFESDIKAEVSALDDEMAALAQKEGTGTAAYAERQARINTLIGEMAANPDFALGEKEAGLMVKRMEARHMGFAMIGKIDGVLKSQGIAAARTMAESVLTDEKLQLSPSERRSFSSLMNEQISSYVAVRKAELEPVKEQAKAIQDRMKLGVGLDGDDVDQVASQLAKGGDAAGAWALVSSRASARALADFRARPSSEQVAMLEQARSGGAHQRQRGDKVLTGNAPQQAAQLMRGFEGFRSSSYWDVNANRVGYGSDTVTRADGSVERVQQGTKVTRADAERDLARRLAEFEATAKGDVGAEAWQALPDAAKAGLLSVTYNYGEVPARIRDAVRSGDTAAIAAAVRSLSGDNGGINAKRRAQEADVIEGAMSVAASGGSADYSGIDPELVKEMQTEVTADAKDLFGDMKAGFAHSQVPSSEEVDLLSRQLAMVNDEDLRAEVRSFFESEEAAASLHGMPAQDRAALMSALDADAAQGASIAQQEMLGAMERTNTAINEALDKDPIGYAASRGLAPAPSPLDFSNPEQLAAGFAERQRAVTVLGARGLAQDKGAMRPDDVSSLRSFMASATPAEQAQVLNVMGSTLKPETMRATAAQLNGKDGLKGMVQAGSLYSENPEAAEGVLRGYQLLAQNPKLAPKEDTTYVMALAQTLPSSGFAAGMEGGRQELLDAARARYADLSAQAGDESQFLNSDRMERAINDVTGGSVSHNGVEVIAPVYGMTQKEFDALLKKDGAALLSGAVTADGAAVTYANLVNEVRLKAIGQGEYLLEYGPEDYPSIARTKSDKQERDGGIEPFVLRIGAANVQR